MKRRRREVARLAAESSAFAGYRFPPEVIVLAVRWYLRFGLSCRVLEELLAERGIDVDHVTLFRWVQRFTPLLVDVALPCRHTVGHRWFVDETYVKVAGRWRYGYRAVDQHGQVIDVFISTHAAVREQQARVRLRPAQGEVAAHARIEDRPNRPSDYSRSRVHAEPAPGPLRARRR